MYLFCEYSKIPPTLRAFLRANSEQPPVLSSVRRFWRPTVLKWWGICPRSNLNTAAGAFIVPSGRGDGILLARPFSKPRHSAHVRPFQRPNVLKTPALCPPSNLNTAAGAFTVPCGRGDGILLARTFSKPRHFAHHRRFWRPTVLKWWGIYPRSNLNTAAGAFTVPCGRGDGILLARPFSKPSRLAHHRHSHRPNVLKWWGICPRSKLNTAAGAFTVPCGRGDGILVARTFSNARVFAHHRHSHRPNVLKCPGVCTPSPLSQAERSQMVGYLHTFQIEYCCWCIQNTMFVD